MRESEKWKWSHWVVSNSQRPCGLQPTRLLRPWDFPGKSTGVGCHCRLQVSMYIALQENLFQYMLNNQKVIFIYFQWINSSVEWRQYLHISYASSNVYLFHNAFFSIVRRYIETVDVNMYSLLALNVCIVVVVVAVNSRTRCYGIRRKHTCYIEKSGYHSSFSFCPGAAFKFFFSL